MSYLERFQKSDSLRLGGFGYHSSEISRNRQNMKHIKTKLRNFSWQYAPTKSEEQVLIENTVKEWYSAKHPTASKSEVDFINSIKITRCQNCGSTNIKSNGKTKIGIQRYYCYDCPGTFNPLTNTIFADRKIPISEWIEYLLHLFEFHSIQSSAFDNRNASSTGRYWLVKVFEVLKGIQDNVVLEGRIWIDETYLPVVTSKIETRDGKKLRGISKNKIGVACAVDENGHSILVATGTSKPSKKSTWNSYGSHIKPGSTIVHDGENSHAILIEKLNLISEEHPTSETEGLEDKDNPLFTINHFHYFVKRFFKAHGGYNRDNLQDWLNLLWYILNPPDDKYDKVLEFIRLAISSPKRVRYRDVMSKKEDKLGED